MQDPIDHPLRHPMVAELHARPPMRLTAPCTVVQLAFKEPRGAAGRDRARDLDHLAALARLHGAAPPMPEGEHFSGEMGGALVGWEAHTEFVRYAAVLPSGLAPFDPARALAVFPAAWQAEAPGRRLAATIVEVSTMPGDPAAAARLAAEGLTGPELAGAQLLGGLAIAASDFRIDPQGWMRFRLVMREGVGPGRTGRLVQRLLELETYRAMAMLALPRMRTLGADLNAIEPQLTAVVEAMAGDDRPAEAALHDLLTLSARLEALAAQSSFRFGATRAYRALVDDRLSALRESRWANRQTLTEFMARRFDPAMRTVVSVEARLAAMLDRAGRAGDLLRTRVDVDRQAQNQAVLSSMDRRAGLQLRLQHTVEGLSVVAISYYALGLVGYAVYPLAHALGVDKAVLLAGMVPVVLAAVWLGMRRIRARLHDDAHQPACARRDTGRTSPRR